MLTKRFWLVLFIAIAVFSLWGLGSLPFIGPDEPRYAQVAREMLAHRELFTPVLGGFPWFEKPVLLYWIVMGSYSTLGVSEYAARLGPAICGLLTGALVYWIGASVESGSRPLDAPSTRPEAQRDGLGRFSALIWFSSAGPLVFSHGLNFDILLTLTLTGALGCFLIWHIHVGVPIKTGPKHSVSSVPKYLLIGFYCSLGLSLLAKGLVGIILVPGILAGYFLIRREAPSRKFLLSLVWGVPLTLALGAIWYGPMLERHGLIFINDFFIQHHYARFVSNQFHHPQAFYFYLPVLLGLALPWTIFLAAGFVSSRRWKWRGATPIDRLRVFSLVWIVAPVIFFSISQSKLPAYILPVLPAVALLAGERVTCFLNAQRGQRVLRLTGALILLVIAIAGIALHRHYGLAILTIAIALAPLAAVSIIALARPQMGQTLCILIAVAMFVTSGISLKAIAPTVARPQSVRDLLAAAAARGYDQTPLVQLHDIDRTAEFYGANQLIRGGDRQPMKLEGPGAVAAMAQYRGGLVLCLVPTEFESQLTSDRRMRTEVIGHNGRLSLVVVRVP
jgi:4-amino-4-deoxy-L-arabinose transferase-like glycosyltransferase